MNNINKLILICILALLIIITCLSCSGVSGTSANYTDNHTYTMDEVISIAQKFSPECRRFYRASENETGSG